jgi:hypothetical protein
MNVSRSIALLSPAVGSGNIGDHFIELAIRRLLGEHIDYRRFTIRRPLAESEIEQINATSCALLCGTNLYQQNWESALTRGALARIRVPVIPFGVGGSAATLAEIEVGDETRQMIRALHERCRTSAARDPHAAAVLARAGVRNFTMTGCPVLFWARTPQLPLPAAVARRRIVVTARNWLMHRWPDAVDHPVQVALLRRILTHFADRDIVFAVHEEFDRNLVERLNIPREIVLDTDDPSDYLELYSDPRNVVFAMRLHAGMLSVANGVPAVFVGHDTRTYSFCRMLGMDYIELFGEDCIDRSIAALEQCLEGGGTPPPEARERFTALRTEMAHFLAANDLAPAQVV